VRATLVAAALLAVASSVTVSDTGEAAPEQAFSRARDAFVAVSGTGVEYLQARQTPSGGFAEPGGKASPQLTAWAALGLRAVGARLSPATLDYLVAHEDELPSATDVELVAMAESVLGRRPERLLARIRGAQRKTGRIGPTVNSTIWGVLALRQAGEPAPRASLRFIIRRQARSGGWSWFAGGAPDSNDTAAAVEALRAGGVRGAPIRRALRYLRRLQNRDGGFELIPGRGSDSPSTAWAIQAFVAAGASVPNGSLRYLQRLRRPDGSIRYSARYRATPVWVTSQALPALARRAYPL
jgi:Prenyltransferase and squalene oxidase repeat